MYLNHQIRMAKQGDSPQTTAQFSRVGKAILIAFCVLVYGGWAEAQESQAESPKAQPPQTEAPLFDSKWSGDQQQDPRRVVDNIMQLPGLDRSRMKTRWRFKDGLFDGQKSSSESDKELTTTHILLSIAFVVGQVLIWLAVLGLFLFPFRYFRKQEVSRTQEEEEEEEDPPKPIPGGVPQKRSRKGLIFTLSFILVVGCWMLVMESYEKEVDVGFSGKAKSNPLYALQELLNEAGVPAKSFRSLAEELPPTHDVLLLASRRLGYTVEDVDRLVGWMQEGGHLVVTPSRAYEIQPLLDALEISAFMGHPFLAFETGGDPMAEGVFKTTRQPESSFRSDRSHFLLTYRGNREVLRSDGPILESQILTLKNRSRSLNRPSRRHHP